MPPPPTGALASGRPPGDFVDLYHAHFTRLAVQLLAYLGDRDEADDVTQEAFCRLLERWPTVSGYEDPTAWVRRVAWNLATSRLRRAKVAARHLAQQREAQSPGPGPDRVALVQALATLPGAHRRAVVLVSPGRLTVTEIAEQEGVAEGTVRSWLTRGRAALAAYFTESTPEVRHG